MEGLDEVVGVFFADVLDPKSSTTREKMMGLVACFQSAGVLGTGVKLKWSR